MPSESKANILLVDDQPKNLLALEAILEGLGQNMVRARSGEEALRCLLREDFALILMDVQMPGLDGLETAALIRQRDRSKFTPIIFLTAYQANEVQVFKGYSLGAVDYLFKPVVPEVLRSKVAVFVELFEKTEQVKRQAEQLRENERQEHERRLAEERHRWEVDRLRAEAAREKKVAEELGRTVAERVRAEQQVREHARRQELVAELGRRALAGIDLAELMDQAVALAAQTLEVEFGLLLELSDDGETLLLRAGVGWKEGTKGRATVHSGTRSQAGFALLAAGPVVVEDPQAETRFELAPLLAEHGVVSGMTLVVHGRERPVGVLGVHSGRRHAFTRDDAHFLQTVAHVLSAAIQRRRDEEELAAVKDELAVQLADMTRLHKLSARLSNTLELGAVLEEVVRAVTLLQGTDSGLLVLHRRDEDDLHPAVSVGFSDAELPFVRRLALDGTASGRLNGAGGEVLVDDMEQNPDYAPGLSGVRRAGFRSVCLTPLRTRGGEVIGTLATWFRRPRRPTDQENRLVELYTRQAAEAIDNARLHRELTEASRRKDEFLAMLAHELRNPLSPILNALQILRMAGANGTAAEKARSIVERQVRHMTRLIDDLLDLSRITRGKIQLKKEPVELGQVLARAVESTRPLIESQAHRLEVAPPPGPLTLEADPTRLEQVLANLLNNAAKYTEPGGRIELTAAREGDEVVVRVKDTGVGIPPEMLERIFDMFMQVDRSLSSTAQWGLGIGLTLVRRLVEMHGGSVRALSAGPGQGSEFVVRLPLAKGGAAPGERDEGKPEPGLEVAATTAPTPPLRVLVADDNKDAVESVAMVLRLAGHEVRTAHDGAAAVAAAVAFRPQAVLLDIGMPGMDGYAVARRLRQVGLDGAYLVAMTGYGQDEDRRRSREAGFDHHLTKPVAPEDLEGLLARPEVTARQRSQQVQEAKSL
jgi:signal transduction histidine kinase